MGGGATIAAAESVGYDSIGVEIDPQYFEMAKMGIPKLAAIKVEIDEHDLNGKDSSEVENQLNSQTSYNLPLFNIKEFE